MMSVKATESFLNVISTYKKFIYHTIDLKNGKKSAKIQIGYQKVKMITVRMFML